MVATHNFHKLVISACLFMKKAPWGCFVLGSDSSGEPAGDPEFSDSCAPGWFELKNFIVASHGGSSIPLFCFRPLFHRPCYHAHQCDRSPAGESVSFCLCWEAGAKSWPYCDELVLHVFIVIYCLLSFVLFIVQQSFLLTLMIFLSVPNLARRLVVHRIRCCFEPIGASRTEAFPSSFSVGRHQWHKWWREQYWWAPATVTFQDNVQNEESLGDEWCWAILCDWAHRCCDKTQLFLLQNLSQGRVRADSWSPRDFAAPPRQQTLSAQPTSEIGDARLGSARLQGEHHDSSSRAQSREDDEGCFGCERQVVPILRGRHFWRNWFSGPESWGDG